MSRVIVTQQSGITVVQIPGTTGPQGPAGPQGEPGSPGDGALTDAELRATPVAVSVVGTVTVEGGGGGGSGDGLTNAELRAVAVPVADAAVVAALGALAFPEGLTDAELRAAPLEVTGDFPGPFTGGLTDAQLRATALPVSGTVTVSNPTAAGLTDTELRATAVPVSGPATDAQIRATPVPVSGSVAVSNFPAGGSGATDAEMRAAVLPTADRAIVVGPFTGTTWAGGNALVAENIALTGLFGPAATPLQARTVQVVLANNTDKVVSATRPLVLTEIVGGRTVTRSIAATGGATIAANAVATVTYTLLPGAAVLGVPRTAVLTVNYSTAPVSGSVVVLAYAFAGPLDALAVTTTGYPRTAITDTLGTMLSLGADGDGLNGNQLLGAGNFAHNGTNWDYLRNNLAATVLASAARTTLAGWTSTDQTNFNGRTHIVYVNITVFASGGLTPKIQGKSPLSGVYYDILTGAKIVATGLYVFRVGESFAPIANLVAQDRLPRTWRFLATPDDSTSITGSVAVAELV